MNLETYIQYHEKEIHKRPGFDYNTYLCTIPQDFLRVGLHWHEQMEIIYIKKGSGRVTINLVPYEVHAGSIVPVLPGELHSIDGIPGVRMEYENIIFSLSILDSTASDDWCRDNLIQPLQEGKLYFPRPITPGSLFYDEVSSALNRADAACESHRPGYSLLVKSSLFIFLHALYTYRSMSAPENPHRSADHADRLKGLVTWVRDHFGEKIDVHKAAEITGYSESHFMRIFRQETGQTFSQFLNDYRLAAACYFLKETSDSIGHISEICGFDSLSYFTRTFHKKYGLSPRQYRNASVHSS